MKELRQGNSEEGRTYACRCECNRCKGYLQSLWWRASPEQDVVVALRAQQREVEVGRER